MDTRNAHVNRSNDGRRRHLPQIRCNCAAPSFEWHSHGDARPGALPHALFLLAVLAVCSCTTVTEPGKTDPPTHLPFRTVVHDRFFIQSADTVELIVLRTLAQQDSFFAAKGRSRSIPLVDYDDSLVVGIIYGPRRSVSALFMIDSVVVNPDARQAVVSSHIAIPFASMSLVAIHSHFIGLPTMDHPLAMDSISLSQEPALDTIPVTTFMKGSNRFRTSDASANFLFLLASKEAEEGFLDTIPQTIAPPLVTFGPFNYVDSLIAGVVSRQFAHVTPFEIVALVRNPDRIDILIQSYAASSLPAFDQPYHFVALRQQQLPFVLRELQRVDSWID